MASVIAITFVDTYSLSKHDRRFKVAPALCDDGAPRAHLASPLGSAARTGPWPLTSLAQKPWRRADVGLKTRALET